MRKSVVPEQIAGGILVLRGKRVLLDAELAAGCTEPVARCGRFLETSDPHRKYSPCAAETRRVRKLEVCT
jgi:hypothetical protein